MRVSPRARHHVEHPEDVGVERTRFEGGFSREDQMLRLVPVGTVVAVGHPVEVETNDLAAVREHINAVPLDRGRRGHAHVGPVQKNVLDHLGDHQLPGQLTGGGVETHQDAPIPLVFRVAGTVIVGPDQNAAARHDRTRIGVRSQSGGPEDVLSRGGVHLRRKPLRVRHHVARRILSPLRDRRGRLGGGQRQ